MELRYENCLTNKADEVIAASIMADGCPFVCTLIRDDKLGKGVSKQIKKHKELSKGGAYLLFAIDTHTMYAGKTTDLASRFNTHHNRPDNESYRYDWNWHLSVTRLDTSYGFSEDEIASLENRLCARIADNSDIIALNTGGTREGKGIIKGSESDRCIIQAIEFMVAVLENIGVNWLGHSVYLPDASKNIKKIDNSNNLAMYEQEMDDIVTPDWMVKKMVDMIPAEKFNKDSKFIDLAAKRGEFLKEVRDRLMQAPDMVKEFPSYAKRLAYIEDNMLFGICITEEGYRQCIENLECDESAGIYKGLNDYDFTGRRGVSDYIETVKSGRYIYNENGKKIGSISGAEEISRVIGNGDLDMKFDVVIGNPPYNKDLYIDFVQTGYELMKDDGVMVMITPAKWQGYGGGNSKTKEKNIAFCEIVYPSIEQLVYYTNATDVFDIALSGGVCYFSARKGRTFEDKTVTVIKNGVIAEDKVNRQLHMMYIDLSDTEYSIINKVSSGSRLMQSSTVMHPERGYFLERGNMPLSDVIAKHGDINSNVYAATYKGNNINRVGIRRSACRHQEQLDKYKLDISQRTYEHPAYTSILRQPNEIGHNGNSCTVCIGTLDECKSADSWYGSKLMYWICKKLYGQQSLTEETFSYLPDPGAFDHIFTDEELYKKYNLSTEEISIIESVIKERK